MSYNASEALIYVKARFEYLRLPREREEYLLARIDAAAGRLRENGIDLQNTPQDTMLLVDMTVWSVMNRDKDTGMPQWLKDARRERWLHNEAAKRLAEEKAVDCGASA